MKAFFLFRNFIGIYPFPNDGIRSVKVRTACRRLARANGRASFVRQLSQNKIFFIEMGATCAGDVTEKTLPASCKIWRRMKGKGKHYRACSGRRTETTSGSCRSADLASLTTST